MSRHSLYLDANSSAPFSPQVVEHIRAFSQYANASSVHRIGQKSKRLLSDAREAVCFSLGKNLDPEQIVFSSSGTEANQTVIRSVFESAITKQKTPLRWITTPVEHDSNRSLEDWIRGIGGTVEKIEVDQNGVPLLRSLQEHLETPATLVSCMWVNNETGVISPIEAIARACGDRGVPLHVDAAQAWGKVPISMDELAVSYLTLSSHKIGSCAGVGVTFVKPGNRLTPLIFGKQEKGRRGGTENLLGISALGVAAQALDVSRFVERTTFTRDAIETLILEQIPGVFINGEGAPRVSNTLNVSFSGIEGEGLVLGLDLEGYGVSAGSACSSGVLEPSHVLLALGRSPSEATAAIRISLWEQHDAETIRTFVSALARVVERMRKAAKKSDFSR